MRCSRVQYITRTLAAACLVGLCGASIQAQDADLSGRIFQFTSVLGRQSKASQSQVLEAIQGLVALDTPTTLGAHLLLDRSNVLFEPDPAIREQAVIAAAKCFDKRDLQNRMIALRVVRIASPASEPVPAVRSSALRSLACFRSVEAASRIIDSTSEVNEPDASVRSVARELLAKGLPSAN
ncbi:MAG TPA: hypothetical protein PKM35_05430 [Holophaga sp.]|nr:hypothetical protein [Holophaga sp.]HPS67834.1 hypothetical protein [Holophaga sp.]